MLAASRYVCGVVARWNCSSFFGGEESCHFCVGLLSRMEFPLPRYLVRLTLAMRGTLCLAPRRCHLRSFLAECVQMNHEAQDYHLLCS